MHACNDQARPVQYPQSDKIIKSTILLNIVHTYGLQYGTDSDWTIGMTHYALPGYLKAPFAPSVLAKSTRGLWA